MTAEQIIASDIAGREVGSLAARYARSYAGRPKRAYEQLAAARRYAQQARQDKDPAAAQRWEEVADVLQAIVGNRRPCRCCGRMLSDPDSVALGIGPECLEKGR